jgi:6-phospho-3-hexuloisomerase
MQDGPGDAEAVAFQQAVATVSAELVRAVAALDATEAGRLAEAILAAKSVFVTGEGRSGMVARAFAMRLGHLGLRASVVGESVTPAAREGDLLVAVSASGETRVTIAHAETARSLGVRVAAVTSQGGSRLARLAGVRLVLSGASAQYGGSLFEQTALVSLDALALALQHRLGQTAGDIDARHANLE